MRILVDCCNYFLDNNNIGDRAVYQVLVKRLISLWPNAEITWITLDPAMIRQTIPQVAPLVLEQRRYLRLSGLRRKRNRLAVQSTLSRWWKRLVPDSAQSPGERGRQTLGDKAYQTDLLISKVQNADLVLALGGGSFSDHFAEHAHGMLETLEGGLAFGKTVALLSTGFESISNASLISRCRVVLPRLQLITCREPNIGPEMLASFGVPGSQVRVTGDEALELAHGLRPGQIGRSLGINLRQSAYSEVDDKPINTIRTVLQEAARKYDAPLLSVPISMYGPSDIDSTRKITLGHDDMFKSGETLDVPEYVINRIGKCRVVISGSYHSAVFALAQGIPVVGIASSLHYWSKFRGLATQFEAGCVLVDPKEDGFQSALEQAIDEAWGNAMQLREPLLKSARSQIEAGWEAYRSLFGMLSF